MPDIYVQLLCQG